jgi:toxin ParE1/3/4
MQLVIAPRARSDIANILAWTLEHFGPQSMHRHRKLVQTAIEAVAADPELAGAASRPEIARNCRTDHLLHGRKRTGARGGRVRSPRHFLLCRVTATGVVEIGRVLHDSMDLEQHFPQEHRQPGGQ